MAEIETQIRLESGDRPLVSPHSDGSIAIHGRHGSSRYSLTIPYAATLCVGMAIIDAIIKAHALREVEKGASPCTPETAALAGRKETLQSAAQAGSDGSPSGS